MTDALTQSIEEMSLSDMTNQGGSCSSTVHINMFSTDLVYSHAENEHGGNSSRIGTQRHPMGGSSK